MAQTLKIYVLHKGKKFRKINSRNVARMEIYQKKTIEEKENVHIEH